LTGWAAFAMLPFMALMQKPKTVAKAGMAH